MAKLMLVEDDNNLREIYEARLQAEGYTIVTAKDGEEALTVAKAEKPDLVISDVMMPKISGFEMLDILRNTDGLKHVRVIMLTALGQNDDQQRADQLGADRYLVKSQVTLEDIVRVAHELLEQDGAVPATTIPEEPAAAPVPEPAAPVAAAPVAEPVVPAPVAPVVPEPVAPIPEPTPVAVPPAPVAVQPEPTAVPPIIEPAAAPVPEPAAPVAAAPVAEPVVPAPVAPVINDEKEQAQSMSEESAKLAEEIESFVAQAPSNPEAPTAPVETAAPAAPVPEPAAPVAAAPVAPVSSTASNDQVMTNAVDSIAGKTPSSEQPEPAADVAAVSTTAVHQSKVITPIDTTSNKPSLQDLLAKEQAQEDQKTSGKVISPNNNDTETVDPNSIAL
jgi:CheY-like chemotaxis protein